MLASIDLNMDRGASSLENLRCVGPGSNGSLEAGTKASLDAPATAKKGAKASKKRKNNTEVSRSKIKSLAGHMKWQ